MKMEGLFAAHKCEIREYFISQSREENLIICPMYDWNDDFSYNDLLYHETMGARAINISLDELYFTRTESLPFMYHFSQVGSFNEIDYLKIVLFSPPSDWTKMWRIRKSWISLFVGYDEMNRLLAECGAA